MNVHVLCTILHGFEFPSRHQRQLLKVMQVKPVAIQAETIENRGTCLLQQVHVQ